MNEQRTYRLSPPDRTGWFLGLGGPQVITLGVALVMAAGFFSLGVPPALVGALLLGSAVLAIARAGGRPLVEMLPSAWKWLRRGRRAQEWSAP
ncbi:MAG: hypothetical protein AB1673_16500 [Actinomycetota bacterium]